MEIIIRLGVIVLIYMVGYKLYKHVKRLDK